MIDTIILQLFRPNDLNKGFYNIFCRYRSKNIYTSHDVSQWEKVGPMMSQTDVDVVVQPFATTYICINVRRIDEAKHLIKIMHESIRWLGFMLTFHVHSSFLVILLTN